MYTEFCKLVMQQDYAENTADIHLLTLYSQVLKYWDRGTVWDMLIVFTTIVDLK